MRKVPSFLILPACSIALLLLAGCSDNQSANDSSWNPMPPAPETELPPPPAQAPAYDDHSGWDEMDDEHIIRDTAYIVVERRQAGGQLYEDTTDISGFDGRPRMKRTPLESMIIVQGDATGQRSAYLLPENDYNVVRVGHRLQPSTLALWESTNEDHIPPPAPTLVDDPARSRTGGAAEQFGY